jgi:hypothetical protein
MWVIAHASDPATHGTVRTGRVQGSSTMASWQTRRNDCDANKVLVCLAGCLVRC